MLSSETTSIEFTRKLSRNGLTWRLLLAQQFLALRQELQQAEEEHTALVRQEARRFAEDARAEYAEEVHHHQIAQAQAQSLLAAERQHHESGSFARGRCRRGRSEIPHFCSKLLLFALVL